MRRMKRRGRRIVMMTIRHFVTCDENIKQTLLTHIHTSLQNHSAVQ